MNIQRGPRNLYHEQEFDYLNINNINFSGMLKEQLNWRDHWPENTENKEQPPPVFIPMKANTWLWVTVPFGLYFLDWIWRKVSRRHPVKVARIVMHEKNLIELVINRWMSFSQPGQVRLTILLTVT